MASPGPASAWQRRGGGIFAGRALAPTCAKHRMSWAATSGRDRRVMGEQGIGARLLRKEDDRYMRGRGQYRRRHQAARHAGGGVPAQPAGACAHQGDPHSRRRSATACSSPRTWRAWRRSAPTRRCRASSRRCSRSWRRARCATSASWSPCASRRRAPRPRTSPPRSSSISSRCRSSPTCWRRARPGAPLVHEHWGDNLFLTTSIDVDFEAVKAKAAVSVTRELRTSRQVMSPLEGRGVVAALALAARPAASSPPPPSSRTSCAPGWPNASGIDEGQIRVVAPDVGGGFGYKGILLPEEVALAWATRKVGAPLRWIEDRRESLTANANCREHHYILTAYADADGRLLALDCEATVDSGAYSAYPFSACLEAGQVGSILPGLYDFPHYRCRAYSVATNKPPILPYRGVARTGVCFALEVTLDALARKLGIEPNDAALQEPGAARADAVRQHRQAPLRLRRLSRGAAPGHRGHRLRRGARAPAARASPTAAASASALPCTPSRPATAPASTRPGASRSCRATSRAMARFTPDGGAGAADRRAQPRPGPGDDAVAGGAFDPRRAARAHPARARRHRPRRPTPPAPGARAA